MPTNDLQFFGLEIFRERNVFIDLWALSIKPFYDTGLFLYPLKTSENVSFPYVFREYGKKPMA